MAVLILLFIVVPAVELALLIEVGSRIGTLPTLGLIVLTGLMGATLARRHGLSVLQRIHADMSRGELPAGAVVDGAIILVAGALLITPGMLTDTLGFLCLIPAFRSLMKKIAWRWIGAQVERQRIQVRLGGIHASTWYRPVEDEPVYDIQPEDDDRRSH